MLRRTRFPAVCLAALTTGVWAAVLIPSQAAGIALPMVQVFTVAAAPAGAGPSTAISAAADGSGELFALTDANGHNTLWKSTADGAFTLVQSSGPATGSETGMVVDAGYEWLVGQAVNNAVSYPGVLYEIDPAGAIKSYASLGVGGSVPEDITVGPDGDLYISDSTGGVWQAAPVFATSAYDFKAAGSPAFQAIGSAGGKLWLTDSSGNLHSMTTNAIFAGPFLAGQVSPYPHTLAGGNDGNLYAVGEVAGVGTSILQINPATVGVSQTFPAPAGSNIVSLTSGPDGNIWFTDDYKNTVGYLDPSTGDIQELPLPSGFVIPPRGYASIQPGPNHTLWFSVQTTGGGAAIGEIGNLPVLVTTQTVTVTNNVTTTVTTASPPAKPSQGSTRGTLRLAAAAPVVKGAAQLRATCVGKPDARCRGTLVVTVIRSTTVSVTINGHRRKKKKRQTVRLGSTSYNLIGGHRATLKVTLSAQGRRLLAKARRHRLGTKVKGTPKGGRMQTFNVALVEPKAKPRKKRK